MAVSRRPGPVEDDCFITLCYKKVTLTFHFSLSILEMFHDANSTNWLTCFLRHATIKCIKWCDKTVGASSVGVQQNCSPANFH